MTAPRPLAEVRAYPQRVLTDRHDFHQLLLGLDGCVELEVAGRGVRVGAGVLAPILAGDEHHYLALKDNDCLTLDLPVAWCESLGLDTLMTRIPRRLPAAALTNARSLATASPAPLARWLGGVLGSIGSEVGSPRLRLIRLLPEIEAELSYPWRIHAMAARCHLAEAVFARQFRALTGQSPYAWLIERRLARARQLMGDSRASLTDIALACGFADAAHFSRVFGQHHACSPRQWRRAHCSPVSAISTPR